MMVWPSRLKLSSDQLGQVFQPPVHQRHGYPVGRR